MTKKNLDINKTGKLFVRPLTQVISLGVAVIVISVLPIISSCCRHSDEPSSTVNDNTVKVSLNCSVSTKAVVNSRNDLIAQMRSSNKGFGIVGFKMLTDIYNPELVETTKLFDNFEVRPDDDQGSSWSYSPIRYWDTRSNAWYQFVGYWPRLGTEASTDPAVSSPYVSIDDINKVLTIHNIPNWQRVNLNGGGNETDYLTAIREGNYNDFRSNNTVDLTFAHLLSKFTVKAYYIGPEDESEYGVRITKVTLKSPESETNVLNGVKNTDNSTPASTDFRRSVTDPLATQVTTTQDANANTVDMVSSYVLFNEESGKIQYKDELADNSEFEPTTVAQWLVVPHVWRNVQFEVDFRQNNSTDPVKTQESAPVTIGKEHDDYAILPGHSYSVTLYFDVSNSGLKVETVAVQEWTEHNVNREVYNW